VEVTAALHILVTHQTVDLGTLAGLAVVHQVIQMVTLVVVVLVPRDKEMLEVGAAGNIVQVEVVVPTVPALVHILDQMVVLEF
jgi:hypothetical protein